MSFSSIVHSIASFGFFTLVSRVLGLCRDIFMAIFFGSSLALDVFLVAFKIPNFFRRIFAEGIVSQVFLPHFAKLQALSQKKLSIFVGALLVWDFLVLFVFGLGFFVFFDYFVWFLAPGFASDVFKTQLLLEMLYFTMPYLFFTSLMAIFGAVLSVYRVFWPIAAAPILLNIAFLISMWVGHYYFTLSENILVYAVLAAGVLQLIFLLFFIWRTGFVLRLVWMPFRLFFASFSNRFWPIFLALCVTQVNLFADVWMASFLKEGSISWLYYADRLFQFPVGVFSVALTTVILSELSLSVAKGDFAQARKKFNFALELAFFIGLPCSIGLAFLSEPIVFVLFGYGQFQAVDVSNSSYALSAYALGLLPLIVSRLMINVLHVHQKSRMIVRVSVMVLVSNILFNLIFMQFWGHVGLALATALASFIQALLLGYLVFKCGFLRVSVLQYFKMGGVSLLMLLLLMVLGYWFFGSFEAQPWWGRQLLLFGGFILPAGCLYFFGTYLFRVSLFQVFLDFLKLKKRRKV